MVIGKTNIIVVNKQLDIKLLVVLSFTYNYVMSVKLVFTSMCMNQANVSEV